MSTPDAGRRTAYLIRHPETDQKPTIMLTEGSPRLWAREEVDPNTKITAIEWDAAAEPAAADATAWQIQFPDESWGPQVALNDGRQEYWEKWGDRITPLVWGRTEG